MPKFLVAYLAAGAVFFALDFVWLSLASGRLYRPEIGGLMLRTPQLQVAGIFYLLYVAGIVALVVMPNAEGTWWRAAVAGGLLGLVAYGTYDVTNLATLAGWSLKVTLVDLAWGTILTALASVGGWLALSAL